ncbi:NADH dehydrogenase [ubiquinone] 1 beta subcomplex subunit 4-like [Onychomys torridus]|uniref:NADH dehydrogenase [ubiquinone] 1 beta subcomplex subunit 4-like n=1 Tax=Onychomys torridus TaxID=38674 RepID=UPI00167F556F|nr:NADH dehydrogenase [ubiquinone] 1 beta subcomplex subunit 4-like [Onychomys torridus]
MLDSKYKPSSLTILPSTLDLSKYDVSPETRKVQVKHLSLRAWLKWESLLQYDDPKCTSHIEDSALICWAYAKSTNVYLSFRPTPKNSLLEAVAAFGPLIFWCYIFRTDRDRKGRLIQEGKLNRTLKFLLSLARERQHEAYDWSDNWPQVFFSRLVDRPATFLVWDLVPRQPLSQEEQGPWPPFAWRCADQQLHCRHPVGPDTYLFPRTVARLPS